nr:MAG TPA: hypothetical protein [Caudoviricetes sp.]
MKTEKQIESAIIKAFSKECEGVAITRREFIRDNISTPLDKFFDKSEGKYRTDLKDKDWGDLNDVQVCYLRKFNTNVEFREASADYLLATSIGATQHGILQKAVFKYADLKTDTGFLQWVFNNHKLDSVSVVCTDTTTRLVSFLNNLYKDYVDGMKQVTADKAEKAAKAAEAKAAAAAVKVMSDEEIQAQIAALMKEAAERKKAAN